MSTCLTLPGWIFSAPSALWVAPRLPGYVYYHSHHLPPSFFGMKVSSMREVACGRARVHYAHYNLHYCAFLLHYLIHIIAFTCYIIWPMPSRTTRFTRQVRRGRRLPQKPSPAPQTGAVTPLPLRRPPTPHPDIPTPPHKERKHRRKERWEDGTHTQPPHRDFTSSHSRARLGGPDFSCASPVPSVVRGSLV